MRFIDFITFSGYDFPTEKGVKEMRSLVQKFFLSYTLRPYTEAILRNASMANVMLEQIKPLIIEYWENIKHNEYFVSAESQKELMLSVPGSEDLARRTLENTVADISHSPEIIAITNKITRILIEKGKEALAIEHDAAIESAFNRLSQGEWIDFEEFLRIYFFEKYDCLYLATNDPEKITVTIQQFISYISFIESIIKPFADLDMESENRFQARALIKFITALKSIMQTNINNIKAVIQELESIEIQKYQYNKYYYDHSNEAPPPGHDQVHCVSRTTYPGIIALWKCLTKSKELDIKYSEKEAEYIKQIKFLSSDGISFDKNSRALVKFFEILSYWGNNWPFMHARRTNIAKLHAFTATGTSTQRLYRNVAKGEADSIAALKKFSQKPQTNDGTPSSFEREKWYFQDRGAPGHSGNSAYECIINLKPGALELLNNLKQEAGSKGVVIEKENEMFCLGIHEDALPFFNNLITYVEVLERKSLKKITEVKFTAEILDQHCVLRPIQNEKNLFFYEPYYCTETSSFIIPDIDVNEDDTQAFESWYEVNRKRNLFEDQEAFSAWLFGLQMACYGGTISGRQDKSSRNNCCSSSQCGSSFFCQEATQNRNSIHKKKKSTTNFSKK